MFKTTFLIALIGVSAEALKVESETESKLCMFGRCFKPSFAPHGYPVLAQTAEEDDDGDAEEVGVNHGMEIAADATDKVHTLTDCYKEWKQDDTQYRNKIAKG